MDMERVDNTASDAQPPVPRGTRNQDPDGYIANCPSGTVNDDPVGCGGQSGRGDPWRVDPCHFGIAEEFSCLRQKTPQTLQQLALFNEKKRCKIENCHTQTIKTNIPDALSSSSERGSGRGGCGRPYTDLLVD